jgi:CCR4-NOT transcription complex subunit 9
MMPSQHVYGQQHHYNGQGEQAWLHQQTSHQHHAQAAALAASQAQAQHYNRIASQHNTGHALGPTQSQPQDDVVSEDNRRTLAYVADLLNENTREAALLELSKKREQVPELALILWHSFGTSFHIHGGS